MSSGLNNIAALLAVVRRGTSATKLCGVTRPNVPLAFDFRAWRFGDGCDEPQRAPVPRVATLPAPAGAGEERALLRLAHGRVGAGLCGQESFGGGAASAAPSVGCCVGASMSPHSAAAYRNRHRGSVTRVTRHEPPWPAVLRAGAGKWRPFLWPRRRLECYVGASLRETRIE